MTSSSAVSFAARGIHRRDRGGGRGRSIGRRIGAGECGSLLCLLLLRVSDPRSRVGLLLRLEDVRRLIRLGRLGESSRLAKVCARRLDDDRDPPGRLELLGHIVCDVLQKQIVLLLETRLDLLVPALRLRGELGLVTFVANNYLYLYKKSSDMSAPVAKLVAKASSKAAPKAAVKAVAAKKSGKLALPGKTFASPNT